MTPHDDRTPLETVKRRPRRIIAGALAIVAATSLAGGGFMLGRTESSGSGTSDLDTPAAMTATDATGADPGVTDLTAVIAEAMRSVVSIRTVATQGAMFGAVQVEGEGSGVVVADGVVVTNSHVVEGAETITISFADGDDAEGSVLATDPVHDLAILSVPTRDHPAIDIGSSSELRLGDTVVALGYPLGLGATATAGIVSGLDRTIDVSDGVGVEHLEGLLQTDAAINPGNSGGPLVDRNGRLVGINTAAASASSAENVGFAIAIDSALSLLGDAGTTT